jgi:ectoine hydroxylase-related dioxygenase (phytanoyl-CoA dioxygenase family)
MEFIKLTDQQRQEFDENGYLVVPQAIDSETVDRLTEAGDRLMDSHEYNDYYAHRRHGIVQEAAFAELAANPKVVPLLVQILSPNIHITNTAVIYKHPQAPTVPEQRNWHRDVGVHLDVGHAKAPRVGLKVGYCLTDFPEPNSGATLFVRKSNNLPEPLTIPENTVDPPEFDEPILRAGDAFLFESRTYHAAGLNFTDRVAKVAMFGYHYRWVKPDYYLRYYNNRLQPDTELLSHLSDIGRQLLGAEEDTQGRSDPNGVHWTLKEWAEQHGLPPENAPQTVKR